MKSRKLIGEHTLNGADRFSLIAHLLELVSQYIFLCNLKSTHQNGCTLSGTPSSLVCIPVYGTNGVPTTLNPSMKRVPVLFILR